jgi:hypothetical protein
MRSKNLRSKKKFQKNSEYKKNTIIYLFNPLKKTFVLQIILSVEIL